jgi:methionyl-tRNA formyltransferase
MRIVFMGTPDFAVASLEALLAAEDPVVGVVTQPDRPKGRGQGVVASPVKQLSRQAGLPILQPTKMKDPAFLDALRSWQPDMIAVAAFGRILPPVILTLPPKGCINVHGSLLPKYRGAAPIQWAIINGEKETGITTMMMDEGMDTGAMLLQEAVPIGPADTGGTLSEKLAKVGGRLLVETIKRLKAGAVTPVAQDHSQATLAPPLTKEHGRIDWSLGAVEIANRVRGMSPWPGCYTYYDGERWTMWRASPVEEPTSADPGTIAAVSKDRISVATGAGVLVIMELQPANRRRMTVAQYLAGHAVRPGALLRGEPSGPTPDAERDSGPKA